MGAKWRSACVPTSQSYTVLDTMVAIADVAIITFHVDCYRPFVSIIARRNDETATVAADSCGSETN